MTDITIPPEALIAGANVVATSAAKTWEGVAAEVFIAMLKAWPNAYGPPDAIILPLTQENTND